MSLTHIRVRGARTHNLKNVDLDLPRDQLIVITGLSGSGKSSLAFDTIYAEGQRRYVESLSAYARQFLSVMEKPDVDHIEGLSPAISIEQKSTSHNPRSTVGTITEIYDYLRLLFARVGSPKCPDHGFGLQAQTVSQMVDQVVALADVPATAQSRYMLLAPVIRDRKGEHLQLIDQLRAQGFVRLRVDGEIYEIDAVPKLSLRTKHTIEAVVDRFRPSADHAQRLAESFENCVKARRWRRLPAIHGRPEGRTAHVQLALLLPGLRLLTAGVGTASVLVQLAQRCLPDLRWPGRGAVLRPRANRGASRVVAGGRCDPQLGSP